MPWQQVLPALTFGASSGSVATAGDLIFQGTVLAFALP